MKQARHAADGRDPSHRIVEGVRRLASKDPLKGGHVCRPQRVLLGGKWVRMCRACGRRW